jgi:calcium-dependent protein kinase
MAPEVLACKAYSEKCDLWSCGVLMHLILSGVPPFTCTSKEELLNAAMLGRIEFAQPSWKRISAEAKGLVQQLLTYDPSKRISAACALKHPWIQHNTKQIQVRVADLRRAIENLRFFKVQMVLQHAVLSYIASQQMTLEEETHLRDIYSFLDRDKDGQISRQDLTLGFYDFYKDMNKAKKDADLIMKNIDIHHTRFIGYNGTMSGRPLEFLMANLRLQQAFSDEKLKQAFEFYDEASCIITRHRTTKASSLWRT